MTSEASTPLPRILIFAPSYEPAVKAGGQARSISNLVRELEGDWLIDVVARDRDLGDTAPFEGLSGKKVTRAGTTVYYINDRSVAQWKSLLVLLRSREYRLVLVNGIWSHTFAFFPAALSLAGVLRGPVALMPHGALEPGALALKSKKKRVFGPLFRGVYRHSVAVFGATSRAEAQNVRRWFPDSLVVTTTNNLPDAVPWGRPAPPCGCLRVLFISRVHKKKGLLQLLRGLSQADADIELAIVGPLEDDGYWQDCREAMTSLPANASVEYAGVAGRAEIHRYLWNADCMVLLTAGENYGHVIAESLQAGCPVITTPTTPWTEVLRQGGGEIIDDRDDPRKVASALEGWARKTPEELADSRLSARAAFEQFTASADPHFVELALQALPDSESMPGV